MGRLLRSKQIAGNFVAPYVNSSRFTDISNVVKHGLGVLHGFSVKVTAPTSTSVLIGKGLMIGGNGEEINFVGAKPGGTIQNEFTAGSNDFTAHDLSAEIAAATGAGDDTLILHVDWVNEILLVSSDTAANVGTNVTTPIGATGDAVPEFTRSLVDTKDPDTLVVNSNTVKSFIIATCTIAGGVISAVDDTNKEKSQPYADMLQ